MSRRYFMALPALPVLVVIDGEFFNKKPNKMRNQFVPLGGKKVNDCQKASFLTRMMELSDRFTDGKVSPEFVLQGIQRLIDQNYGFETIFGPLELFGPQVKVRDFETPYGRGPSLFFEDKYAKLAEMKMDEEKEKLTPLFTFKENERPDKTFIAPYLISEELTISEMLDSINCRKLHPRITLNHIDYLMREYISGRNKNDVLYEGKEGNFFPIYDNKETTWLIWLWLHNDGKWYYKFSSASEYPPDKKLKSKNARFWLLPPTLNS